MRKTLKTILKAIFIIVFCISFVMVTGQSENMKYQILWTLGWAVVMALSAYGIDKLIKDKE